jgi:hypothetical protein
LGDQEKWLLEGFLNYNIILQLDLFCKRKENWTKISYTQLFYLQDHPEWLHNCYPDTQTLFFVSHRINLEKEDQKSPLTVTKLPSYWSLYCSTLCPPF